MTTAMANITTTPTSDDVFGECLDSTASGQSDPANDAVWILTSTFIIFTMQSGFGLLESGSVTTKNEVNIMVKNAIDVIVGGLTYWVFGYAFSFGDHEKYANSFSGWGYFFVNVNEDKIGEIYSHFFFQSSFATTATTIVSGAMAERTRLEAYIAFSLLNTLVFCFPAHWVWDKRGFLRRWGMVDIAGDGPVHLVGGMTGLVATLMLKPRYGRYTSLRPPQMGSPTNALLGMFMLWWGWLGFNCGSTFGISGPKWKLAARSAVVTLCGSMAGGLVGLVARSAVSTLTASTAGGCVGLLSTFVFKDRKFDVPSMINGILASLVSVTGICALAQPWEGFVIGAVGAILALLTIELLDKIKVDDPVGVVGVHAVSSIWGLMSVGLFAREDKMRYALGICHKRFGLFYGGGAALLGTQMLGAFIICVWTIVTSFVLLKAIELTIGLRMSLQHEIMGADLVEHGVGDILFDKENDLVIGLKRSDSLGKRFRPRKRTSNEAEDISNSDVRQMPNGDSVRVRDHFDADGRDAKLMWRVAVGKSLNPVEQSKRKRAIENFDLLFTQRQHLRQDRESPSENHVDGPKNETCMDFNENSYENYGFSRDSVPRVEASSSSPQSEGFFARFRRNFQRKNKHESEPAVRTTSVKSLNLSSQVNQSDELTIPSPSVYI